MAYARRFWGRKLARVSQLDLKVLLSFLRETYAVQHRSSFRIQLLAGLQKLVPSAVNAYNEVDLQTHHNTVVYDRPETVALRHREEIFDNHISQHPLISYYHRTRDPRAMKISDFLSRKQFHRLGLYNEFFRRIGIEDQMAMSFPGRKSVIIGIALNRTSRSFSERDRLLLNLAHPHLLQACRNAEAWTRTTQELVFLRRGFHSVDKTVIFLRHGGQIKTMPPKATLWIAEFFPGSANGTGLPELLQRWVRQQCRSLAVSAHVPDVVEPLVVKRETGSLRVSLFPAEEQSCLLLERFAAIANRRIADTFRLTPREAEVLSWLAQGKSNLDLATILAISPRTIQKHLERIFQKLGVETRTAAVAKLHAVGAAI